MIRAENKSLIFTISLILMMLLITGVSNAEELTFEEALKQGLQTTGELKDIRENIKNLQKTLASLNAQQDWQVELGAQYNHTFSEEDDDTIVQNSISGEESYDITSDAQISADNNGGSSTEIKSSSSNQKNINLGISRTFPSGLSLTPEFTLKEEGDTDFSVSMNYPVYPLTPTEPRRQIYRTEKELVRVKNSLLQKKADLILSWLERYLSLVRIIEKEKIYEDNLTKAEENLKETLERQKLGEAGKQELLTARLGVKEAEYGLAEIKKQIEEAKTALRQSLELKEEQELVIEETGQWYQNLIDKTKKITTKYTAKTNTELIEVAAEHNYDLKANRIEREILKQELNWLQQEGKTDINLTGSYNSTADDFTVGINVSHQLYDGGQQEIEFKEKEAEIAAAKDDYKDIYLDIESQLKQYQNKIELSKMKLEKEELSLEKSEYEAEVFQKQLDRGLLDYLEYQEKWLNSREVEINYSSLKDQLLVDRLNLIAFVNIQEVAGGLFND